MKRPIAFIFFGLSLFFPFARGTFAQIAENSASPLAGSGISMTTAPAQPSPYDTVTVTLSSVGADLDGSDIQWSENGKQSTEGVGQKKYIFTAKGLGVSSNISAVITDPDGDAITKTITVTPMNIDILWQATDSIVPPFYEGKAMPSSEGQLKFVAIPQVTDAAGTYVRQSNLVYDWRRNYAPSPDDSGYGKNFFSVSTNDLHPTEIIAAEAATRDGATTVSATAQVTTGLPKILWYSVSPLYGPIFDHALADNAPVAGNSTSLLAEPYFFSPNDPNSTKLSYAWTLNGQTIDTPVIPDTLFLQRSDASLGTADVSVSVSNADLLFQEAEADLTLNLQ